MPAPSPEVIAGKYRLLRKLGQGGMGSVWYAEHLTLESPVAIKLIDPSIADNAEALSRFLREAQSAASLRSPHVVQILDHGVDNGVPYIAMELLDGESLADRLDRVTRLSAGETAWIVQHVGRAIGRAHEAGIVHRDLKPDNIYLVRNDDEEMAKVLDFGIAKANSHGLGASVGSSTRTGAVLGTPYYMSPEQAEGAKSLDGRADIWAMGVIAFECLLGSRPFDEEALGSLLLAICARPIPIPSQRGPVPAGFDHWFARACARDVTQRFASAREAASELRLVCEGIATNTGNYASALSAERSGGHPLAPSASAAARGALSGQSVAGLASTQMGQPAGVPRKRGTALAFALLGAGILAGAGGLLTWAQFGRGTPAVASASVNASAAATLLSASAHSEPSAVVPLPVAAPSGVTSSQTTTSEPVPVATAKATPVAAAARPAPRARPQVAHASPAVRAHAAPPQPALLDSRVNLGL